ncbi:MAG: hypothetical protein ORN28_01320, partial [Rhodoferax sp.]|nr:hypothetical protein [Rhodoferax sp.]
MLIAELGYRASAVLRYCDYATSLFKAVGIDLGHRPVRLQALLAGAQGGYAGESVTGTRRRTT